MTEKIEKSKKRELERSKTMNKIADVIHVTNVQNGWFEGKKNIGEMIALIHSEASEMLEADREDRYSCDDIRKLRNIVDDKEFFETYEKLIKGSFEEENADLVIRALDMASFKLIDIDAHIEAKLRYNSLRPPKHGGKKY